MYVNRFEPFLNIFLNRSNGKVFVDVNDPLINAGSIFVRSITGGMVAQPFTLDICYEKTATKFVSPSKSSNFKRWMPPVAQIHCCSTQFNYNPSPISSHTIILLSPIRRTR